MNRGKLKELVLLICSRCQADRSRLGAVKLNKIIWYVEAEYYLATQGKTVTGVRFTKQKAGPVPAPMPHIIRELIYEKSLTVKTVGFFNREKKEYITHRQPDLSLFSERELTLIENAIDDVCDCHTAKSISDMTHTAAWEMVKMGDTLPLFSVLAKPRRPTSEDLAWADSVISTLTNAH